MWRYSLGREKVGEGVLAVQLGKRYKDAESGVEVLCIKAGDCDLRVDDRPLEIVQPRVLPSAD